MTTAIKEERAPAHPMDMNVDWDGREPEYNKQLLAYFRYFRKHPEKELMPEHAKAHVEKEKVEATKQAEQDAKAEKSNAAKAGKAPPKEEPLPEEPLPEPLPEEPLL